MSTVVSEEERQLMQSMLALEAAPDEPNAPSPPSEMHPVLKLAFGTAFVLNLGVLLSLPPVLMSRGAPYLPTFKKNLDVMFKVVRRVHPTADRSPRFVDLGSGDGRVVFRAAREGLFRRSVGYEINPLLHVFAAARRLSAPKYWGTTEFELGNFWNVSCAEADVVTVYGLHPIMDKVGLKLKQELRPGALVVSNVFQIPGWRQHLGSDGVFVYQVPCWDETPSSE
eukprot:TRINITY_DN41594_c0_g1_i1.p1 TRINITY_DN41594_c0_g1~~TRINITY_DN41594_c0_g1_i1.p1  ORF type:complete len:225 (+),score=41.21 TRINITY_DN41594_c0_g1_i1:244-918(+)